MRTLPALAALAMVGGLGIPTAAADDSPGSITATVNFALGSSAVGDSPGFLAPGGHFDLGFRVRRWRLAAELDTALWSKLRQPDDLPVSGSFVRAGVALRWSLLEMLAHARGERPAVAYRIYVEAGLGRQRIEVPGIALSRNDVMIGLGVSPEISFGRALFGANFGMRVVIANAPEDQIARTACMTCSPTGHHDLTLLYTFGFVFGR